MSCVAFGSAFCVAVVKNRPRKSIIAHFGQKSKSILGFGEIFGGFWRFLAERRDWAMRRGFGGIVWYNRGSILILGGRQIWLFKGLRLLVARLGVCGLEVGAACGLEA